MRTGSLGAPTEEESPDSSFIRIDEKIADVNLKLYESARSEIIQRIVLRDGALLFYIASVGTYINFVVGVHFSVEINNADAVKMLIVMFPLPVVCVIFSLIILQHHLTVGRIGAFLRHEFNWGALGGRISRHWDNSNSFLDQANRLISMRLFAQGLILCLPLLYDVVFFYMFCKSIHFDILWLKVLSISQLVINVATFVFVSWLHLAAHTKRKREW